MTTIHIQSRADPSGVVNLRIPIGIAEADVDVVVVVQPVRANGSASGMSPEAWKEFVMETAGSIRDPSFTRPPQGPYEHRAALP